MRRQSLEGRPRPSRAPAGLWPIRHGYRRPGGARWYHQHFSVSKEPFRLTAWFGPHNPGRDPGAPGEKHTDYTAIDVNEGGTAIPYWMEDPHIRAEYEALLKKNDVEVRMKPEWYEKPADTSKKLSTVV